MQRQWTNHEIYTLYDGIQLGNILPTNIKLWQASFLRIENTIPHNTFEKNRVFKYLVPRQSLVCDMIYAFSLDPRLCFRTPDTDTGAFQ